MGVDKKNVRTVVHLAPPTSTEAYLQESGRASRDGLGARAWLIWTPDDVGDLDYSVDLRARRGHGESEPESAEAIARIRRLGMIRYAASTDKCRREMLLNALGIEASDCNGCDVCGGEQWSNPPEEEVILKVIRWNRRRFRKGQAARILIGRRTVEIRRAGLDIVRGFGALAGWELEDAEEAIGVLLRAGKLRYGRWGPWKGRIFNHP